MSKSTTSGLADHYIALGREQKAAAIRTWLNAVGAKLRETYDAAPADRPSDSTIDANYDGEHA